MSEQTNPPETSAASPREALQALLDEGLDGPALMSRVRGLFPPDGSTTDARPTTDEATDHPGYQ